MPKNRSMMKQIKLKKMNKLKMKHKILNKLKQQMIKMIKLNLNQL